MHRHHVALLSVANDPTEHLPAMSVRIVVQPSNTNENAEPIPISLECVGEQELKDEVA